MVADLVHVWCRCHACGAQPIGGLRFECQTCPIGPDNDLCERCYLALEQGQVQHPMPGSFAQLARISSDRPHSFRSVAGRVRDASASWLTVPDAEATAPNFKPGFVVRPEFHSKRESFIGPYAFVVDGPPTFLLTALHVLGGLIQAKGIDCSSTNQTYSGRELPAILTKVNLFDAFAPNWVLSDLGTAGPMLPLPDARIGEEEPFSQRDIAAFRIQQSAKVSPARLAQHPPRVGEPVWLVAKPEARQLARAIQAVVVEETEKTFVFRYKVLECIPPHSSGAPLIDRQGEVVGINVGAGMLDGHYLGHASHVTTIRQYLRPWLTN